MRRTGKRFAIAVRASIFSLAIGSLVLQAGCDDSGSPQTEQANKDQADAYKKQMAEMKKAGKVGPAAGGKTQSR